MSSEYQELLEKLLNSDTTDVIPQSRAEYIILTAINSLGIDTLPEPGSRMEAYLMALIMKMGEGVPTVTTDNNGQFLRVVNGVWAASTVPSAEEASF